MEWVDYIVLNCKPRVLCLAIHVEDYNFCIPSTAFNCASLEEMELVFSSEDHDVFLPDQVFLPSLKKLTLCGALLDNVFFQRLCSGSCLLEKLVLDYCMMDTTLQISSSPLKHFFLRCYDQWLDVQINAPSLIYLDIQSNGSARIFLENLRFLVGAQVQIYDPDMYCSTLPGYLKHIRDLANATTLDLTLSSAVMKGILEKELFNFPTFTNLKTLVIGKWCMANDFELVAAFLKHSPNLQMLKLFPIRCNGSNLGEIARGALFLKEFLQTVVIETERLCNSELGLDFIELLRLHDDDGAVEKAKMEFEKAKMESVDLLLKQLCARVRTIGEIKIIK